MIASDASPNRVAATYYITTHPKHSFVRAEPFVTVMLGNEY
jgi:hypothetical protein